MATDPSHHRGDVLVVFGETNIQLKGGLRYSLRKEGYSNIKDVYDDREARAAMRGETPDILVLDAALSGDIIRLIRDVRAGKTGPNSFVPVILTSWSAEADAIKNMLSCGADEILLKPFAAGALFERIHSLVSRRKPYLATQDYIGPDRRGGRVDPNAPNIPLIHPPNTLKAKLDGKPISREELAHLVQAARVSMVEQRIARDTARLVNLSRAVEDAAQQGRRDQKLFSELDQLAVLGVDLGRNISETPYSQVAPILMNLSKTAVDLRDHLPELDEKKAKLLLPLAEAVSAVIGSEEARKYIADVVAMMKDVKPRPAGF